ncbi:MAG: FeoA family protein [Rickettsiella sp.]|nr:FeoA family protein [Rickettsiella sp.]
MVTEAIPLTQLRPGQSGIVQGFSQTIAQNYRKYLQDIGINRQSLITFIRQAPFGGPLQLQILGSHFCLRASEACHIYVTYSN